MGSLWVAHHLELEVDVALKFSHVDEDLDSQKEQRFKREAQAAARLKSPHIVQIHDYGLHDGVPYIAMELLNGEDLGELLQREGRVSVARALGWLRQAGKALRVVHGAGVVHRDIKPSNLFLAEDGGETVLKMLDFGIAKAPRESGQTTSAGLILGSPAYMSPEQARGNPIDERSDLWSLAAVFYRMITGCAPFEGCSSGDILVRVCTEDVAPPSRLVPELGEKTDAFFHRALTRNPTRRFTSVRELIAAANELSSEAPDGDSADPVGVGAFGLVDAGASRPDPAPGRVTPTASLRVRGADVSDGVDAGRGSSSERLPPVETTQPSPSANGKGRRPRAVWLTSGGLVLVAGALAVARGPWSAGEQAAGVLDEAAAPSAVPSVGMSATLTSARVVEGRQAESAPWPAEGEPGRKSEAPKETSKPPPVEESARKSSLAAPASSRGALPAQERPRKARVPDPAPSPTRADPVFGLPVSDP